MKLWFYALLHFANSAEGVDAPFLSRHLGISYAAAFRMAGKIRLHLAAIDEGSSPLFNATKLHVRLETIHHIRTAKKARNIAHVLFLASSTHIDSVVIKNPLRYKITAAIRNKAPHQQHIVTTCYRTWRVMSKYGTRKNLAEFDPVYFLDHPKQPNLISGFLNYFFNPLYIHHRHVSYGLLWKYLKEYQFRFNRRSRSQDTFWDMVSRFPAITGQAAELIKTRNQVD